MPRLIWTAPALRDVSRLHGFLAAKDRLAARRAVAAIRRGVRTLARHSEIGRPVADMDPAFREWWIPFGAYGYVVLYRHEPDRVVLLAIRHGRELGS